MHGVLAQLVFYCGEIEILLKENLLLTLSVSYKGPFIKRKLVVKYYYRALLRDVFL